MLVACYISLFSQVASLAAAAAAANGTSTGIAVFPCASTAVVQPVSRARSPSRLARLKGFPSNMMLEHAIAASEEPCLGCTLQDSPRPAHAACIGLSTPQTSTGSLYISKDRLQNMLKQHAGLSYPNPSKLLPDFLLCAPVLLTMARASHHHHQPL